MFSTLEFPKFSKIHFFFRNVQFLGGTVPLREKFLSFTIKIPIFIPSITVQVRLLKLKECHYKHARAKYTVNNSCRAGNYSGVYSYIYSLIDVAYDNFEQ